MPTSGGSGPLLKDSKFLRLWAVGALTSTGRWLEMLAVGIFVFDETGSPLLVATMLMLRMLPLGLFGLFGGEIASRFERRRVLLTTLGSLVALAAALGTLAALGQLAVWHVGVGAFVAGLAWVLDFPVRRTLLADIAGSERLGAAMSLDTVASSGTRLLGPLLGGGLYAVAGMEGAFFLTASAYGIAMLLLLTLRGFSQGREEPSGGTLKRLQAALGDLRRTPVLQGILATTVVFNVWGFPVMSMVPVIGAEELHLLPAQVGLLASMEGLGSLLGAFGLAAFASRSRFRQLYYGGTLIYLLAALGFANSGNVWASAGLLLALGLSLSAFAAMQSTLILLNAPEASRQRMMGLLSVCIGSGPLGLAHLGILSNWLGASAACSIVAAEGLVALALALWRWPELLRSGAD